MSEKRKRPCRTVPAEDYIYASARVRAGEAVTFRGEDYTRLAEAADFEEALRLLSERGFPILRTTDGQPLVEASLDAYLQKAFATVAESVPDGGVFAFLRYPYDCHNLKSVLKCSVTGRNWEELFLPLGTLDRETVARAVETRDFSLLPPAMAEGTAAAMAAYASSRDPQQIDRLLDNACFADMLDSASGYSEKAFLRLVQIKIDLQNLLTALRLLRMEADGADFMSFYLSGGTLSPAFFGDVSAEGENDPLRSFEKKVEHTPYARLSGAGALSPSELERLADEIYLGEVSRLSSGTYGPQVIAAYLVRKEYEAKNLRILLAGKKAGLPSEAIRVRLREVSYGI